MLGDHLINFEGIFGAMAEWQTQWTQNPPSKIVRVRVSLALPRPQHVGKLLNFCMCLVSSGE